MLGENQDKRAALLDRAGDLAGIGTPGQNIARRDPATYRRTFQRRADGVRDRSIAARMRNENIVCHGRASVFSQLRKGSMNKASRIHGAACRPRELWLRLGFDLPGHLLNLDDDKLRRLKGREADDDVNDAKIDIVLGGGFRVALHEITFLWTLSLKRALSEQTIHEHAGVESNLRPKRLLVRFEHHPLRAPEQAFLNEERRAPDGNVFPFGSGLV